MNASRRGALILGGRRRGDRGRTSRSRDRARIRDRRVSASWTHLVLVDARRREERPEADLAEHRLEAGEGEQGGARELVHLVGSERRDRARRAASAGTDDAPPIFLADPWAPTPLRPRADASAARNVLVIPGDAPGERRRGRAHAPRPSAVRAVAAIAIARR